MAEPQKNGYKGYRRNGYTVLLGPNKNDPSLVDAAIVGTEVGLMGVQPDLATAAINSLVDQLPSQPS